MNYADIMSQILRYSSELNMQSLPLSYIQLSISCPSESLMSTVTLLVAGSRPTPLPSTLWNTVWKGYQFLTNGLEAAHATSVSRAISSLLYSSFFLSTSLNLNRQWPSSNHAKHNNTLRYDESNMEGTWVPE